MPINMLKLRNLSKVDETGAMRNLNIHLTNEYRDTKTVSHRGWADKWHKMKDKAAKQYVKMYTKSEVDSHLNKLKESIEVKDEASKTRSANNAKSLSENIKNVSEEISKLNDRCTQIERNANTTKKSLEKSIIKQAGILSVELTNKIKLDLLSTIHNEKPVIDKISESVVTKVTPLFLVEVEKLSNEIAKISDKLSKIDNRINNL